MTDPSRKLVIAKIFIRSGSGAFQGSGFDSYTALLGRASAVMVFEAALATFAWRKKIYDQRWGSEHSRNQFGVSRVGRRAARRRRARRRRRGGAVQSHQAWQVGGLRQPASIARACDPFLPEACRAHRRRYRSRGLLVRPRAAPKTISRRVVGSAARGNLPAAAWPGARRRRGASRAAAAARISFRAPPSGACRLGLFPVRLRSRGHPHHRRDRRDRRHVAGEGRRHAYPAGRNLRLSALDRLPVGGAEQHLGFSHYDASKVMGLAAYGDPEVFRRQFRQVAARRQGGLCGRPGVSRFQSPTSSPSWMRCSVRRATWIPRSCRAMPISRRLSRRRRMRRCWRWCGASSARCRSTSYASPAASRSIA